MSGPALHVAAAIDGLWTGILVLVLLMIVALVAAARDARGFEALCRRTAAHLGGTYHEEEAPERHRIRFRIRGRESELAFQREGEGNPTSSRVEVDVRGVSPGYLIIAPQGFGDRIRRFFGAEDLKVGDPGFDEAYAVRASHEQVVRRLFAPAAGRRAVQSVWSIDRFEGPSVDLNRERLLVQVRERLISESDIRTLLDAARTWVDLLIADEPVAGVTWIDDKRTAEGECQVCGSRLRDGVVHCASCRTPHHRECWEYIGECSTFACRERRFV